MRGVAALLAALVAGTVASALLMQHVPAAYHVDMLAPLPVATNWGTFGLGIWAVFFAMLVAASAAYGILLSDIRLGRSPIPIAGIVTVSLSAVALLLWYSPLFSSDVYAYAAYGEMARIGMNPYLPVAAPSSNALIAAAAWQWSGNLPVCVYGEAFVAVARGVVTMFVHQPLWMRLDAMRFVAGASLSVAALLLGALRPAGEERRFVIAAVACNPVLLWCAAEGHNDALTLALALGGVVIARRYAPLGIAVAAAAALVKLPAAAVAAALIFVQFHRGRIRAGIAGSLTAIAIIVAGSIAWFASLRMHATHHGAYAPAASLQGAFAVALRWLPAWPYIDAVLTLLIVIALGALTLRRAQTLVDGARGVALCAWLLIPNPYPWYAFWVVPLLALLPPRQAIVATIAFSLGAALRYLPDAASIDPALSLAVSLGAIALYVVTWIFAASPRSVRLL